MWIVWIVCVADNSHEMSNLIFDENVLEISSATIVPSTLKVNVSRTFFLHLI